MTKYSTELKIEIVQKYFNCQNSIDGLAKEQGITALKVKHKKDAYSLDFKLNVVRYYKNHRLGTRKIAAKFNLSPSQVYDWNRKFDEQGTIGLIPKVKGRPPKVLQDKPKEKLELSEKQRLEQRIIELEEKLKEAKLDNYILKKVAARYPRYPTKKRPK